MARKTAKTARKRKKKKPAKTYRFQLTLPGVAGIAVVSFCLFLWMFLLGVWAGQTFLLPSARPELSNKPVPQVETLSSRAKKKPAAPSGKD